MEYLLLIPLTFLLGGLLLLLFMRPCPSMENAGYVLLTPEDAARQLLCSERILLLDVRDIEELEDFSLPRAHNVPLSMLADQIGTLAPRLSTPIFLCCDAGTRSRAAALLLLGLGYDNAYDAWEIRPLAKALEDLGQRDEITQNPSYEG